MVPPASTTDAKPLPLGVTAGLSAGLASDSATAADVMDKRSIAVLALSHVFDDLNQGALPTLLPYLIVAHHLSYQAAAGLVLTTNLFSSLLQPWIGTLSDRPGWKINLAPIGLAMAGIGVAFTGVMPNYFGLLCIAAIGGIGLAAYHPDAARTTNFVSGPQKATGMSFFALGGNVGFAVGPLVATACVMAMGVRGSLLLLIPAFGFAAFLHRHMKGLSSRIAFHKKASQAISTGARDRWVPFSFLTLTIICRSIIFFGFNTFLPLYWIHHLGQTKAAGGFALTVLLLSSAVGTLMGGKLADRIGDWKLNFGAIGCLPFLIGLFLMASRPDLAMLSLIPLGICMSATFSVMVVMGQRYLPRRIGLAAGVTLGLAGSTGGLIAPVLGKLADSYGLHAALSTLIGVALLSLVLAGATALAERFSTR